jgi:hypothetical protein
VRRKIVALGVYFTRFEASVTLCRPWQQHSQCARALATAAAGGGAKAGVGDGSKAGIVAGKGDSHRGSS